MSRRARGPWCGILVGEGAVRCPHGGGAGFRAGVDGFQHLDSCTGPHTELSLLQKETIRGFQMRQDTLRCLGATYLPVSPPHIWNTRMSNSPWPKASLIKGHTGHPTRSPTASPVGSAC